MELPRVGTCDRGLGPGRKVFWSIGSGPQPGGLPMGSQFRLLAITAVVAIAMSACDGGSSPPPAPTVTLTSSATDVGVTGGHADLVVGPRGSCTASGDPEPSAGTLGVAGRRGVSDFYIHDLVLGSRWRGHGQRHGPCMESAQCIPRGRPHFGAAERDRAADLVFAERHRVPRIPRSARSDAGASAVGVADVGAADGDHEIPDRVPQPGLRRGNAEVVVRIVTLNTR